MLSAFAETEADAVGRYAGFVAAGEDQPSPWEQLKQGPFAFRSTPSYGFGSGRAARGAVRREEPPDLGDRP
jgi:hypothetical protein